METVRRRKVTNLLALAVLAYLNRGPMHPYEIGRTLREHGDSRSIKFNQGSLYMVVRQLTAAGMIVEQETTRAGQRPERTVFALTETGRHELRDWLRELVEQPMHEYPHFVAALSLIGTLPPDEVVDLLQTRLQRLNEQLAEVRRIIDDTVAAGVHPLFVVEEEYRLALLQGESDFVERFIERITHPKTGWGRDWARFHRESPTATTARNDERQEQ